MSCQETLTKFLKDKGVPFEVHHHPPAYTAQALAESEHVSGKMVAKVVVVMAEGKLRMLVAPGHLHVNLVKAAAALGEPEVRLASEDEFGPAFGDCEVGAMPPFGNLYGLDTYVDRQLAEDEAIVFNAGSHEETVHMKYVDFERLAKPVLADLTA